MEQDISPSFSSFTVFTDHQTLPPPILLSTHTVILKLQRTLTLVIYSYFSLHCRYNYKFIAVRNPVSVIGVNVSNYLVNYDVHTKGFDVFSVLGE